MNNILISNPFLSRPDSPVSSQEVDEGLKKKDGYFTDFNIQFQKSQFDEAWENTYQLTTEGLPPSTPEINSLFSVSSPTISSTSESSDLEDLFPMEGWADSSTINFGDFDTEFSSNDTITADLFQSVEEEVENSSTLSPNPLDLPDLNLWDIYESLGEKPADMAYRKEQEMFDQKQIGKTLPPLTMDFMSKALAIPIQSGNTISNVNMSTILPAYAQGAENQTVNTVAVLTTPQMNIMSTRSLHKRKEALEHRMVAPSPQYVSTEEEVEKKPDIQALGINNGQQRMATKRRTSTISNNSNAGPSSSKNIKTQKKPRKYELDVADDPSVRNAKAAKMNRDKKKRENQDLKNERDTLKNEISTLKEKLAREEQEKINYKNSYFEEKQKNQMSAGVQKNITTVKKILEAIIEPLNKQFGHMEVDIPESFANIPAREREDGSVETFVGPDSEPNFNILDESYQMIPTEGSSSDTSTFTTFHISPQERKIRLDYNPQYH